MTRAIPSVIVVTLSTGALAILVGAETSPMPSGVQEKPDAAPVRVISTLRGVASRRGPSTGLKFVPSTDSDYRRTERLRFEVAVDDVRATSGRLLGPTGTPLNLPVTITVRPDEATKQSVVVAELTLAALAPAEYELDLTIDEGGEKEIVTYRFGIVP